MAYLRGVAEEEEKHIFLWLLVQLEVKPDLIFSTRFKLRLVAAVAAVVMAQ